MLGHRDELRSVRSHDVIARDFGNSMMDDQMDSKITSNTNLHLVVYKPHSREQQRWHEFTACNAIRHCICQRRRHRGWPRRDRVLCVLISG
jgi:hypothetical protein